jgi:hypothetical protein
VRTDGVTTLTTTMTFRDKASRDEDIQGGFGGVGESFDRTASANTG